MDQGHTANDSQDHSAGVTQSPSRGFVRELATDIAGESARTFGPLLINLIGILGLIVAGAICVGIGLYFQLWLVAIVGGVLIGAGVLWAVVLAFFFLAPYW